MPDLEVGLAFYRDRLGHELNWRTPTSAGLRMPDTDAEIVLQTERPALEANILVESVGEAVRRISEAGGTVLAGPFNIQIGRCTVVADPWGNALVLLDMSKGRLVTDEGGNVIGTGLGQNPAPVRCWAATECSWGRYRRARHPALAVRSGSASPCPGG